MKFGFLIMCFLRVYDRSLPKLCTVGGRRMNYDCGAQVECCWQGKPMILVKETCTTVTLTTTDRSVIYMGSNKCTKHGRVTEMQ